MQIRPDFTHLWLEAPETLFSDPADYQGVLGLLAQLCPADRPLLGYCLLADQMHLLLAVDRRRAGQLADQLMQALAGSADHPLRRAWQAEPVDSAQLPARLAGLHRLPCELGLVGDPDVHPWTSHGAYAYPAQAPAWLATELFWQHWPSRRAGRVRAYLHLLHSQLRPAAPRLKAAARQTYRVTERQIAERVLRDHQCNWRQLASARMARRKRLVAGLSAAIARGLGVHGEQASELPALFGVAPEQLAQYELMANREAGQYLVSTASALISQPAAEQPHRPEPPLLAEPVHYPEEKGETPFDYLDADGEPGLRLVL